MSLLRFLRVIESIDPTAASRTRGLPRNRRLVIEVLEGRAVLAALDEAPLADPPPDETPVAPTVLESPPSDPVAPAAEGDPVADPLFEDPIDPPISQPPVITSLEAHSEDGWVSLTGTVTDADGPVAGLMIHFMVVGDGATDSFTATVLADGTFESTTYVIPAGSMIFAYTIDIDGNHSEVVNTVV